MWHHKTAKPEYSPGWTDDDEISLLANFQRPMCVRFSQGKGCIDGGSCQGFRHGHPHVYTGQVHNYWLTATEWYLSLKMFLNTAQQIKVIKHTRGLGTILREKKICLKALAFGNNLCRDCIFNAEMKFFKTHDVRQNLISTHPCLLKSLCLHYPLEKDYGLLENHIAQGWTWK